MSQLTLDPALITLMEIHCRQYRVAYGHLRLDGMDHLAPLPFPHRQMPGFFGLRTSAEKDLKLWIRMEKILFDHYEIPLEFLTYLGINPRTPGKSTVRSSLLDSIMGMEVPILPRRDMDYRFPQPSICPEQIVGIAGKNSLGKVFDGLITSLQARGSHPRPKMFTDDWFVMTVDEDGPEVQHSTDYRKQRGWKRIPMQHPNPATPSPVLLALLQRSA